MKAEARHLKDKAIASLLLAIELFNRPHEGGRVDNVLILLGHAFEMLLGGACSPWRGDPGTEREADDWFRPL